MTPAEATSWLNAASDAAIAIGLPIDCVMEVMAKVTAALDDRSRWRALVLLDEFHTGTLRAYVDCAHDGACDDDVRAFTRFACFCAAVAIECVGAQVKEAA